MGKQQVLSVTTYVFLFLSLSSQIYCSRRGIETSHFNVISRLTGVNLQESKENDLITELPGQPPVNFKQYGGYVTINETSGRYFYYYFVEAIKASESSPLVLWLNGGPGSSSLAGGALTEHGPFRVNSDGKTLYRNPYAWNEEANVLYLETPAGVGFSYTNTPEDMNDPTDAKAAEDNYTFLVKWLEKFPEYKGREFYITGQSYAGHYGPQLAQIILNRNKKNFINLRGISLGSPGLDKEVELKGEWAYLLSHNIISKEDFVVAQNCQGEVTMDKPGNDAEKCVDFRDKINEKQKHIDMYNIHAPLCKNYTLTEKPKEDATVMVYEPCSQNYVTAYLNNETVQKAIHVKSTKIPYKWEPLNNLLLNSWSGNDRLASIVPILKEIMSKGVRIWVYSGEWDWAIPVTTTMQVLKNMNLTVENSSRQWFSGGKVGGDTENYKENLTFASVKKAGHSVPTDQPIFALTIFKSFLRNTPLPTA